MTSDVLVKTFIQLLVEFGFDRRRILNNKSQSGATYVFQNKNALEHPTGLIIYNLEIKESPQAVERLSNKHVKSVQCYSLTFTYYDRQDLSNDFARLHAFLLTSESLQKLRSQAIEVKSIELMPDTAEMLNSQVLCRQDLRITADISVIYDMSVNDKYKSAKIVTVV